MFTFSFTISTRCTRQYLEGPNSLDTGLDPMIFVEESGKPIRTCNGCTSTAAEGKIPRALVETESFKVPSTSRIVKRAFPVIVSSRRCPVAENRNVGEQLVVRKEETGWREETTTWVGN